MVYLTVVERCRISPPPLSAPPVTLPLTHFDIPWLLFAPNQPLFFYDLPISAADFTENTLPTLKRNLSLSLQHFFPLAGNLVMPTALSAAPHLEYTENDSISLTVAVAAEADAGDFQNLVGDHPKTSQDFHDLVPELGGTVGSKQPLLAIQIIVFPKTGICIGFTLQNVVADWRTFNNFLRDWASLSKMVLCRKMMTISDRWRFMIGGVHRLPYTVPTTYVGNCVGFGRASSTRTELLGVNGIVHAIKAIGDRVTVLNEDIMCGAQNWISEWKVLQESDLHVIITESLKLGLYELDFGWGKPIKVEEVSIDKSGSISVTETRGMIGGIELGVALTKPKMDLLITINKELNHIIECE